MQRRLGPGEVLARTEFKNGSTAGAAVAAVIAPAHPRRAIDVPCPVENDTLRSLLPIEGAEDLLAPPSMRTGQQLEDSATPRWIASSFISAEVGCAVQNSVRCL